MKAVNIYSCGGFAMGVCSSLTGDGYDIAYIDSSKSNENPNVDPDRVCYVSGVKGVGGSGGHRANNYKHIQDKVPGFLEDFPPTDLNIVVFSLSGGTGSTAGPLITSYLQRNGHPTVCVVLGDPTSEKFLENTINTLKSLEGISGNTGLPVVVSYHENGVHSWGETDELVAYAIEALASLGSQQNAYMDIMDVTNFFQYSNVTNSLSQLACLDIFDTRQAAMKSVEPIAIASLYTNRDEYVSFGDAKYNIYGFPTKPILGGEELHFVINHSGVEPIITELNDHKAELSRKYGSHKQRKSLVDRDDNMDDNGMVL